MKFIKIFLRVALLSLMVVLGLTIVFPQWLDFAGAVFSDFSDKKKQQEEQQVYEYFSKYPIREDWQLTINGSISDTPYDMDLIYTVVYSAQKDKSGCHSYSLFGGEAPDVKWYRYSSKVSDNRHSIVLPLNEHPAYKGCHYQPENINIGLSRAGEKPSRSSTLFGNLDYLKNAIKSGYSITTVSNNKLDLECRQPVNQDEVYDSDWACVHQADDSYTFVQKLTPSADSDEWNINIELISKEESISSQLLARKIRTAENNVSALNRLISKYRGVVNEPARRTPISEILDVINNKVDLSANYSSSPFLDDFQQYSASLEREIPYENGVPIDPWGNPYQYSLKQTRPEQPAKTELRRAKPWQPPRAELYSLGPDGIESNDDIGSWNKKSRR